MTRQGQCRVAHWSAQEEGGGPTDSQNERDLGGGWSLSEQLGRWQYSPVTPTRSVEPVPIGANDGVGLQ